MIYNADRNLHFLIADCTESTGTITVSSDLGGIVENVLVTNKFKER